MRTKSVAVLATLFIISLLVPTGAWARRVTAGGSLTISSASGPLTTQLVVAAITANPGLEKTILQQLPLPGPLYVLPFFVDKDKDSPKQGDLDMTLGLTNTTSSVLSITLTLRGLDGSVLATSTPPPLMAHETRAIQVSDLLP